MKDDIDFEFIYKDSAGKGRDPDKYSVELGETHCKIWTRRKRLGTLKHNPLNKLVTTINGVDFVFAPDSITNSFRNSDRLIKELKTKERDLIKSFSEDVQTLLDKFIQSDYTIGSSIIFPVSINNKSVGWTMNIARGLSSKVHDRIDYTLECIKRFYDGNMDNPLLSAIERSAEFFRLFDDFNDYVRFFFLDDFIDENGNVKSLTGTMDFANPFPITEEKYIQYLTNTISFVDKRNQRMKKWYHEIIL